MKRICIFLITLLSLKSLHSQNIKFDSTTVIKTGGSDISHSYAAPFVVDWDNDGKQDLLVGEMVRVPALTGSFYGKLNFYRNVGSNSNPILESPKYVKVNGQDIAITAG